MLWGRPPDHAPPEDRRMGEPAAVAEGTVRDGLRLESDSMGKMWVPADRYWGAETQRALTHFAIGAESAPIEVIRALAKIKKAATLANMGLGRLPEAHGRQIIEAAEEV